MINNFSIFKLKEQKSEKSPTHTISARVGEEYVQIGSAWTKKGNNGVYLSCQLSKPFTKDSGEKYDGYVILSDSDYKKLVGNRTSPSEDFPDGINLDDQPF